MSAVVVVMLLLVSPVVEETVFRAGLLAGLQRRGWSPASALGLSTLAFALAHGLSRSAVLGVGVILPGLLLGGLYLWRGRLRWCVAAHAAMNLLWLICGPDWLRQMPADLSRHVAG